MWTKKWNAAFSATFQAKTRNHSRDGASGCVLPANAVSSSPSLMRVSWLRMLVVRQLVTCAIITFLGPRWCLRVLILTLCPGASAVPPRARAHFHLPAGPHRETLSSFTGAWKMRVLLAGALLAIRIYVPCPVTDTFYAFSTLRSSRQRWISSADALPFGVKREVLDRIRRKIMPWVIAAVNRTGVLTRLLAREK